MRPKSGSLSSSNYAGITVFVLVMAGIWMYVGSVIFLFLLFKGAAPIKAMPWTLAEYVFYYHSDHQAMKAASLAFMISTAGCVVLPIYLLWPKGRSLHGDARFANKSELRAASMLNSEERFHVVLGIMGKDLVTYSGTQSGMLAAPTGSGKGVAFVIPTLYVWDGSAIVLDPKKELWKFTSKFRRAHGQKTFLFDPLSSETHCWNVFDCVPSDRANRIDVLQRIGHILFPDPPNSDPVWTASSRNLWLGVCLYLLETGKPLRLGTVAREIMVGDKDVFDKAIKDRKAAGNPLSQACELALRDYTSTPDKMRDSIRKTFTSRLEIFMNPAVDAATSKSDFDISQLRSEKISIYLGTMPVQLPRLAVLFRLFFEMTISLHTNEKPEQNPALKYPLLLLPDEFAALGKMQVLSDSLTYIRGYNIRIWPVFQSPTQVIELLGANAAETFFENLPVSIIYRPERHRVAKEVSEFLGTETVKSKSKSRPAWGGKGGSNSQSDHARELMKPQELLNMPEEQIILKIRGMRPILCKKNYYYTSRPLVDRMQVLSPTLAKAGTWPKQKHYELAEQRGELAEPVPTVGLMEYEPLPEPVDNRPKRPVEAKDMSKLESMSLSDFGLDFSKVKIPEGDMSEEEAAALADDIYAQMMQH